MKRRKDIYPRMKRSGRSCRRNLTREFNNWNIEEGIHLERKMMTMVAELALVAGHTYQYRYL